jgi:hypothetical protein
VNIRGVLSAQQRADMLTKPNNEADLRRHRKAIMGW